MNILYTIRSIMLCVIGIFLLYSSNMLSSQVQHQEFVTIAILAKDKAHTLPFYLQCIENQTWPKKKTYIYIRTNNNNDDTVRVLREWMDRVYNQYAYIYFDDSNVAQPVEQYKQHEWNGTRFKVLGKIRQDSVDWAREHNSHYFVADCDNFIVPNTIEQLVKSHAPIVAPLLRCNSQPCYANYHMAIDQNGYYDYSPHYFTVFDQAIKGLIVVPVVHCTYLVRHEFLHEISYDDESWRYEYVIFSDCARKKNITQYFDNRAIYGYISFAETQEEFDAERPIFDEMFTKL